MGVALKGLVAFCRKEARGLASVDIEEKDKGAAYKHLTGRGKPRRDSLAVRLSG